MGDEMDFTDRLFAFENMFHSGQMKIGIGEIYQVSELSVIRGGEISLHSQPCDEITYAISGSADFISGDERLKVKAGQIHFIKQGFLHKIEASQDENFRYICIGYIPNPENSAVKAFHNERKSKEYFVINDNGIVKNLSELVIREFYNYDDFSSEMINYYISQMLITLTRFLSDKNYVYDINHSKKSGNYAMYRMLRYIDREYMQIESVKEISTALSYSEYYLSHLFREKMGVTIKEYITKKKILYATELLRTSELTVEQIAEQLKFSCAYTFRRAFKKYTGCTPCEYRKLP